MTQLRYWHGYGMIVFALLSSLGISAATADGCVFGLGVRDGDCSIYYDLSAAGDLLEINYVTHVARRLGRLSDANIPSNAIVTGRYLPRGSMAYLWASQPAKAKARLWMLDVTAEETWQTDVLMVVGGDSVAVPVARDTLYLRDYEEDTSRVLSLLSNTGPRSFTFELREETPVSVSEDGEYLFVANRPPMCQICKVCLQSGAVIERIPADSFRITGCDDTVYRYACMAGSHAVLSSHSGSKPGIQLQLVNLATGSAEARSGRMAPSPAGFSRAVLVRTDSGHALYNIGVSSGRADASPTGVVCGYRISSGGFQEIPTVTYGPSEKIVLVDASGASVLADRVRFDYISMLEARPCRQWSRFDSWDARREHLDQVREGKATLCGAPDDWSMEGRVVLQVTE